MVFGEVETSLTDKGNDTEGKEETQGGERGEAMSPQIQRVSFMTTYCSITLIGLLQGTLTSTGS